MRYKNTIPRQALDGRRDGNVVDSLCAAVQRMHGGRAGHQS